MTISKNLVNGGYNGDYYYVSEMQEYQRRLREQEEYYRRQQNMYPMNDDTDFRAVAEQPKPAPKKALNKNLLLCEDI